MDDLLSTIARIRRAMPRNEDVMKVCAALETSLIVRTSDSKSKFDRRSYQREYMRRYRTKKAIIDGPGISERQSPTHVDRHTPIIEEK